MAETPVVAQSLGWSSAALEVHMCGIAGIVDSRSGATLNVARMTAALYHRGPDSAGSYIRPGAAIGQSRLAIIDLVTGDPPITNEDGAVGVVLNGEVYNYRDLQERARRGGHVLKTACDTEVIAHLAEDLDPVALAQSLDGMFAFAVWDDRVRRLTLGRDRFGKKPLYYWHDGHRFVFGSEIKAVLAETSVPKVLDCDAIPAYLTFGYVPTPRTFFDGIRSVPPAHVLTLSEGVVSIEPYWSAPLPGVNATPIDCSFEEATQVTSGLLRDAVERRMVSDVPLGAFLSGGVDSSTVVGLMAQSSDAPIRTFTIGFEDSQGFDERPFAAEVAKLFGTDHTEFVVNPEKSELIERLVFHHDQPFGDSSALPTYLLAELTKQHVTVALCGDGGDELFGGYERFAAAQVVSKMAWVPSAVSRRMSAVAASVPPGALHGRGASASRLLNSVGVGMPDAYLSWISFVPEQWRRRLVPAWSDWAADEYRRSWSESEGAAVLDRLLHLNSRTYLLDDLLPKVDRMAMAHGLEVRSPFLDTKLAEFVVRLAPSTKIRGLTLKRLLKASARDLLPPHLLNRRKRGFGVPLNRWFREDLRTFVEGLLTSRQSAIGQHLDTATVRCLLDEHQAGIADHGHTLWTLVTLELFLRQHRW